MNRKRGRLEIIRDILSVVRDKGGKVRPTHILYRSNLSSEMLKQYIEELVEKEFLQVEQDKKKNKYYSLLPKGYNYIADYKVIKGFIDSYGLD